jgi:hypothetical protein
MSRTSVSRFENLVEGWRLDQAVADAMIVLDIQAEWGNCCAHLANGHF